MSYNPSPQDAIRPLKIGDVVSTGFVLYRSHLKTFLSLAGVAVLWSLLPLVALSGIIFILGFFFPLLQGSVGVVILLGILAAVGWFWALFYGIAKYWMNAAHIARIAFLDLTNQPERLTDGRQYLQPRLWSFLRVAATIGIRIVLVYLVVIVVAVVVLGSVTAFISATPDLWAILLTTLIFLLVIVAAIFVLIWIFSRWMIAEVPLAVEPSTNGLQSVDRSWNLTQGSVRRVLLIASVAFMITVPVLGISNLLPSFVMQTIPPGTTLWWSIYGFSLALGLLSNIIILPFWQSLKAVIYYDLRSRKEGIDLQLRDRHQHNL